MRIFSKDQNDFYSENFDILLFYSETLLFVWHGDRLKVFPYNDTEGVGSPRLLKAPGEVKNVQSFDERIFVTCSPSGVYKLSKNYQFALLSSTAIGIGARFYHVLRLEDEYISLGDKQSKTSRLLLKHKAVDGARIRIAGVVEETVDDHLFFVLLEGAINEKELCILSNGNEIYKITQNAIKIIYNCSSPIVDIVEVKENDKLKGFLYMTNKSTAILMYAKNDDLVFEKIEMNQNLKTAYAIFDGVSESTVSIVHSDGKKTYISRKILGDDSIESTELNERNILCLRIHNSKIFGLTSTGELVLVDPTMNQTSAKIKRDDFVKLKHEMLEGTDSIVEAICDKIIELQSLDNELLDEQNALKRINLVACQQNISAIPDLRLHKIANQTFVNCKLACSIPEKCQLSFSVKSGGRKIFTTKKVVENNTDIELPVPDSMLSEISEVSTDLITLAEEDYSWCFIKNCIKGREGNDQVQDQIQISDDKINFVNTRLDVLKTFKIKDQLDLIKLNSMKNSIRKEFKII